MPTKTCFGGANSTAEEDEQEPDTATEMPRIYDSNGYSTTSPLFHQQINENSFRKTKTLVSAEPLGMRYDCFEDMICLTLPSLSLALSLSPSLSVFLSLSNEQCLKLCYKPKIGFTSYIQGFYTYHANISI